MNLSIISFTLEIQSAKVAESCRLVTPYIIDFIYLSNKSAVTNPESSAFLPYVK
nr:MAG TPA: hypothetical protein [Caudoviricetes sp.]